MLFPQLDAFLARHASAYRIAFSGGAEDAHAESWIRSVLAALRGTNIVVITGGTDGGVPGITTSIARELDIPLIGVLPQAGVAYRSRSLAFMDGSSAADVVSADQRACAVVVPPIYGRSSWGDAAPVFVGLSDAIVAIGGSWGTAIELSHACKVNTRRVRHGEPPIRIVPAPFRGVVTELAAASWMTDDCYRASFPPGMLKSASDVAMYLRGLSGQPRYRPPR